MFDYEGVGGVPSPADQGEKREDGEKREREVRRDGELMEERFSITAELAGVPEVDVVVLECPVKGCGYRRYLPEYDPANVPVCPHHHKKLVLVNKNG